MPNKAEAELPLVSEVSFASTSNRDCQGYDLGSGIQDPLSFGSKAVLLKGGHLTPLVDNGHRVAQAHPGIEIVRDGSLMYMNDEGYGFFFVNSGAGRAGSAPSSHELVVDVLYQSSGSTGNRRTRSSAVLVTVESTM